MAIKRTTTRKSTRKTTPKEITDLYEKVATCFDGCEKNIYDAQDAVGYSNLKQTTKTALLKKFQLVWKLMNEIVDDIGKLGKVR